MSNQGEAVETNLTAWLLAQAVSVPDVELHLEADVSWIFTRKSAPGNNVMMARFTDERVAAVRSREILAYHLMNRASSHWTIGPATRPANLGPAVLRPLGYSCRIHCAGMHCDLLGAAPRSAPKVARGVSVRLVEERPLFEPITTERRRRHKAISDGMAAHRPQRVWYFGAWLDGKAVGRTTLFVSEESAGSAAGIYDVEVLKHARYRGIGTMLVYTALQQAIHLGKTEAVLAATGAGQGVYERMGFREVTKISFWMYGKTRQQLR